MFAFCSPISAVANLIQINSTGNISPNLIRYRTNQHLFRGLCFPYVKQKITQIMFEIKETWTMATMAPYGQEMDFAIYRGLKRELQNE